MNKFGEMAIKIFCAVILGYGSAWVFDGSRMDSYMMTMIFYIWYDLGGKIVKD